MHIVCNIAAFLLGGINSYAKWVEYNTGSRFEAFLFLVAPAIFVGVLLRFLIAALLP